ncbi:meprin A subunit beta-like isoform X2 [Paramacrobiotus metropolitanus]|uniref:meprin A subunit beta-like isoform X2 n=1 Tax=Paramacrobiotus metropolitanus TaxID=2943436 RepID=UPI00244659CC|nr:meprin A subunit beta-like isoform X2 [Paramacrobiotus metropolitanus]
MWIFLVALYLFVVSVCSFDDGDTCGWGPVDGLRPNYQWNLISASSPAFDVNLAIPVDDLTQAGSGLFLYFNTSATPARGTILTKEFIRQSPDDALCLKFWTYMKGSNPGDLYLMITGGNGGLISNLEMFALPGRETRQWEQQMVQMPVGVDTMKDFTLTFEGRHGIFEGHGGIAMDNISTTPGLCR